MSKLIVIENDPVEGTDTHNVGGQAKNPAVPPTPPTIPYVGTAVFDYLGKMTDQLSDLVKIDGAPVSTMGSKSTLNPGESASPAGKHSGPQGKNFSTPPLDPIPFSMSITEQVGDGFPSAAAGSSFVSVDGDAVLLDRDSIDTCDGLSTPGNSTVTAENQDFVNCSE